MGYYVKQNKSEKDKHCMISFVCGILKTKQMSKLNKTELIDKKNSSAVAVGKG